jgi:general secretion pathway protein A
MLLQYFGFKEEPFGVNPDPRCLFLSRTHQHALDSLGFGFANNRGFTAMIAPPGMGKTTLLFRFLEDIRDAARVVFLFDLDPQCEPREFVAYILRDLGIVPASGSAEMHEQLSNAVIKENRAGRKFVIVIDEAQNLSDAVLERVRLLTNFETSRGKLIQIVLSGQSQLSEKLQHASLVQLRQRISTVCHIESLSLEETVGYIDYRVKIAGYLAEPLFTAGAVKLIAEASHGTPRTINNLCYNALALCHKMRLKQLDAAMVSKVIAGLQLTPPSHETVAAAAAVTAAAPAAFHQAVEQPMKRQRFTGLQLIPSMYEPAVTPSPVPVAARADAPIVPDRAVPERKVPDFVVSDFEEVPDEPAKPKFWQRTKLRVLHILPATTGSVMLWVPSAAIILVVSFLGVLRLSEVWAPQPHSTGPESMGADQSNVLAAPPSAPAPNASVPDGSDPSATESSAPSDPGSPNAGSPAATRTPVPAPKPMQASATIPKPSPAIASPAAPAPKPTHAAASVAKPSASAQPSASTAKGPSASKQSSASTAYSSRGNAPVAMPDVAHPAVMVSAPPSGQNANHVAAQPGSISVAPTANAPKQVRAALSSNLPNAPVTAAQPSASASVRPALPQNSH